MIDHIGVAVADIDRAKAFYTRALQPLGIRVIMEVSAEETGADAHAGFGADDKAFFWIGTGAKPKGGTHVAFAVGTRAEVDAFYSAAMAAEAATTALRD
jgi:catechol 2,3-dioxygenase-like lactoylglutathione lyase family enzyme